jgi:O-antigen ligase
MPKISRAQALVFLLLIAALLWVSAVFVFVVTRHPAAPLGQVRPDLAGTPGVNLDAAELASPDLAAAFDRLDHSGIRWLRLRLPWDQVEPQRGQFEWAAWDRIFGLLAQHPQLIPVVVLDGSPAWARGAADAANPLAPPHERADFGAYAAAVAARYGGQVRYYQIWDEPNIAPHWGARAVDPADYLGLLREAAVQVRGTDAGAQIVLGALAPTIETGGANLSDVTYLDQLYGLGGRAWFDIVAAEPYGFSLPPDAPASPAALNFGRAALLHDVMLRHGDADTPVWGTAFGWNAAATASIGDAEKGLPLVTEAEQARYAADALALTAQQSGWLGPLFWAADCPPASDQHSGLALCDGAGKMRPAWDALVAAAKPVQVLPPGVHQPDHPALHYSAGWRVRPAAADPSRDGDTLSFSFYGSGLSLRVQGGPYWAFDYITVDGRPANALPRDEQGATYLVLYDPAAETRVVPVASGLPAATHQVTLTAMGGWGQWALQGFIVAPPAASSFVSQLDWRGLAGLAALLTLGIVVVEGQGRSAQSRPLTRAVMVAWAAVTEVAGWLLRLFDRASTGVPDAAQWALVVLCAAVFIFSHWLPIDLLALAGLGLLFVVRPALALPLIAFSIPLLPHTKPIARWNFSYYEIWLLLGVAAAAFRWLLACTCSGRWQPHPERAAHAGDGQRLNILSLAGFDWPVLALLAVGLAASFTAPLRALALHEWRTVFLLGGLFYWLITRAPGRGLVANRGGVPMALLDGLVLGMVCVSVVGLWQLVTGQGRIDVEGVWRVRAFYGSPNNLALALDRTLPLALAVALFGVQRTRRSRLSLRRWLYLAAAAIIAAACVGTFSKGALLLGLPVGIGLVLLIGALQSGRRWPLVVLLAGVVTAGGVLIVLFRTPRFADLLNFRTGTSFFRIKLWQSALHMALAHPWLGVGPDNFLYAYRSHYVLPSAWQELNLNHPHNILLDLWTRLGLFGVGVGVWLMWSALRRSWQLVRHSVVVWPVALGLGAGLVVTLTHGLIDNSLFLMDLMALFMLTLGVLTELAN